MTKIVFSKKRAVAQNTKPNIECVVDSSKLEPKHPFIILIEVNLFFLSLSKRISLAHPRTQDVVF